MACPPASRRPLRLGEWEQRLRCVRDAWRPAKQVQVRDTLVLGYAHQVDERAEVGRLQCRFHADLSELVGNSLRGLGIARIPPGWMDELQRKAWRASLLEQLLRLRRVVRVRA